MMVKFLAHGTGSAAAAAAYLLGEGHHEKDPDPDQAPEEITVLRGNPGQVTAVADALAFEHRYTSGLFAWAPEDAPSDRQISRVLDEFEKTAWAGLEPDRYAWAAVQHRNAGGGVHVHILAARCDLATGKSLNIAPLGWEKTFGALRDWQNHEHGWSRPDDPERARDLQPGHMAYIDAAQLRAGLATEPDPRRLLTDYVRQGIEAGVIEDRATMVAALQRAGLEVPRQGKNYLTVADPASGGRWRLKGAIYDREFSRERPGSPAQAAGRGGGADARARDQERAQAALRQLLELRRSRGAYHRETYGEGAVQGVGAPGRDRPVDLSRHLRRELGPDALPRVPDPDPHRDAVMASIEREQARHRELLDQTWGVWLHEAQLLAVRYRPVRLRPVYLKAALCQINPDDANLLHWMPPPSGGRKCSVPSWHIAMPPGGGVHSIVRAAVVERLDRAVAAVRRGAAASRAAKEASDALGPEL